MLENTGQRTDTFTWVAAKHGRRAYVSWSTVPWQPGSTVTAACGTRIRPTPWPFVLPRPCPDCERLITDQENGR